MGRSSLSEDAIFLFEREIVAKMIVIIGENAEQSRQFAEQIKAQRTHELTAGDTGNHEVQAQDQEAQQAEPQPSLDLTPAHQPAAALERREPEVKTIEVTPIDEGGSGDGGGGRNMGLPGPEGAGPQPPQTPAPDLDDETARAGDDDWKPPKHEFGHSATDDPRQMLLTEMQKDGRDIQSAIDYAAEHWPERRQPEIAPDAPQPPPPGQPEPDPHPGPDAAKVEVIHERELGSPAPSPDREAVIDAEFTEVSGPEYERYAPPAGFKEGQNVAFTDDVERRLIAPVAEPEITPEHDTGPDGATQEAKSAIAALRQDIADDKTVVVIANEYNDDLKALMQEARAQGHRVQVAVIGERQEGQVTLKPDHLQSVPELSKDSHYVSVYAQNDAGKYVLHGTNYNDQAKVTPSVAPEVGHQLARGVEAKGLHDSAVLQKVDGFKDSHPAVTKMQAQTSKGMDFQ